MSKSKKHSKTATSTPKSAVKAAIKTKSQGNGKPTDDSKLSGPMQAGVKAVEMMAATSESIPRESKLSMIVKLLQRPEGATLDDIVAATGWQKHTVRGALSHALGKKRGYQIVSDKPKDGKRIYKIVGQKQ